MYTSLIYLSTLGQKAQRGMSWDAGYITRSWMKKSLYVLFLGQNLLHDFFKEKYSFMLDKESMKLEHLSFFPYSHTPSINMQSLIYVMMTLRQVREDPSVFRTFYYMVNKKRGTNFSGVSWLQYVQVGNVMWLQLLDFQKAEIPESVPEAEKQD